jgi:hypothetical protein
MSKDEVLYDAHQHGELLRPEAASERLRKKHAIKLGVQRLADLRSAGGGPRFIKPTQREVRYPAAMLDEWAEARNRKPLLDFVPVNGKRERVSEPPKDAAETAEGADVPEHPDAAPSGVDSTEAARRAKAVALTPRWR